MPLLPSSAAVFLAAWLACGAALARDPAAESVPSRPLAHLMPSTPPGGYTLDDWKRDWPGCDFEDGVSEDRVSVVASGSAAWWRVAYNAGGVGPDRSGAGWRWPFTRLPLRSCDLTYVLRFDDGFEFVKGGKLPGLCGGPDTITGGDACDGRRGWSVRLMWRRDGRGQAYVYHAGKRGTYGDEFDFPADARFPVGAPVAIRIAVTMNDPARADGRLRVWIGDPAGPSRLVVDRADLRYTAIDTIGVDSILFNTFHGGHDRSWAPRTACSACFTDFRIGAIPDTLRPR
jgi:hypothetical protein